MSETESNAFFTVDDDLFVPGPACRGPWDPKSLNGRVIAGLLGGVLERRHGDPDFLPARLTVDMYRLPGFAPIDVRTSVIRDGNRIRVVDAEFISNGTSMARATCQFLRKTQNSPGRVWGPDNWSVPTPLSVTPAEPPRKEMGGIWETRPIEGGFGQYGLKRLWSRELRPLFDDRPLTPYQRCALAADFASPFSNGGDQGLGYINSDVTLYLHRLPAAEFIGFETINHHADAGVAHGQVFLYDEEGPIGSASVAALAQRAIPAGPRPVQTP